MSIDPDFQPAQWGLSPQPQRTWALPDARATRALGRALATWLRPGDFLGLTGTLGAGKTTLMQGVVEASGAGSHAASPTYTLVNLYEGQPPIAHLDLYRLESEGDLESIGYWDLVADEYAALCVEWFTLIPASWPGQGAILQITHDDQGGRVAALFVRGAPMTARLEDLSVTPPER